MKDINYILKRCDVNNFSQENIELINKAYDFAKTKHQGKFRKTTDEFIRHPLEVACILSDLNVDATTIIAALIHETTIESDASYEEIENIFGSDVKIIVTSLEKINKLKLNDSSESSSIYLRKVLVGLSTDVRVILIKLADRLHNMRTLHVFDSNKQKQKVMETKNVLIPIAHRLGINSIKSELEDLCLKYSNPDEYQNILDKLDGTSEELNQILLEMKESIQDILSTNGIKCYELKARVKSISSIYTKLTTGRKWEDIYDILALRAIVDKVSDCYLLAGLIHAKYRPVANRFKDYISMPKANMYQSLHTSVFGTNGHIFEIQIRTKEMDEIAEHGIASHWSYKEHGSKSIQNVMEQKLELFRNTIDSHKEETNDEEFRKNIEEELFSDLIYVFTPKGDVMELPLGSTPIDFAYRVHSKVGDTCVGAIINDNIVTLDYKLKDGDIVRINTNPNSKPNKDWLNIVKTTQAKNKIKSYFSKADKENYIETGKNLLEKEIKRQKKLVNEILNESNINKILKDLKLNTIEDLYLQVGSLRYTPTYVLNLINNDKKQVQDVLLERVINNVKQEHHNYKNDIIVDGFDDILVTLANCCHPVLGDEIIGYITKGEGINVHKKDCINVKNLQNRIISVKWNTKNEQNSYITKLTITTNSKNNNLLPIVTKASSRDVNVSSISELNSNTIGYSLTIKVKNSHDLELFIDDLKSLPFVIDVIRGVVWK